MTVNKKVLSWKKNTLHLVHPTSHIDIFKSHFWDLLTKILVMWTPLLDSNYPWNLRTPDSQQLLDLAATRLPRHLFDPNHSLDPTTTTPGPPDPQTPPHQDPSCLDPATPVTEPRLNRPCDLFIYYFLAWFDRGNCNFGGKNINPMVTILGTICISGKLIPTVHDWIYFVNLYFNFVFSEH